MGWNAHASAILARPHQLHHEAAAVWMINTSIGKHSALGWRSPANAAHLQRSLEQAARGEMLEHRLHDQDLL
jgi:hypothetical protein